MPCVIRLRADEKRAECVAQLTSQTQAHDAEATHLRHAVGDGKTRIDVLNHQMTQMERERSLVECDNKALQRRLAAVQHESIALKEEVRRQSLWAYFLCVFESYFICMCLYMYNDYGVWLLFAADLAPHHASVGATGQQPATEPKPRGGHGQIRPAGQSAHRPQDHARLDTGTAAVSHGC